MVLENPGWYTPYTPYQAEIAQGRLESLLNFQTMVADLTGMEVANASLLDEATAAAEAMTLLHRVRDEAGRAAGRARVSSWSAIAACRRRSTCCGRARNRSASTCTSARSRADGASTRRRLRRAAAIPRRARARAGPRAVHRAGARGRARSWRSAPTCWRWRCSRRRARWAPTSSFGNSQRFGVPLGYGGPHAAFFATRNAFVRQMPGRIIGVSVDAHGHTAYRMALATREQHIRREKATSNICTAQALLANMAAMYAVYHGPDGLKAIAGRVHRAGAARSRRASKRLGIEQPNAHYFDTLRVDVPRRRRGRPAAGARSGDQLPLSSTTATVGIALNETVTPTTSATSSTSSRGRSDSPCRASILRVSRRDARLALGASTDSGVAAPHARAFLTHPVFNTHRSETEMMRYIRTPRAQGHRARHVDDSARLLHDEAERGHRDAAGHVGALQPHASVRAGGSGRRATLQMFRELEAALCEITGFAAVSLQPNSGAQGEFAGPDGDPRLPPRRGDRHRDVVLIPASAHGTNPASAAMAGMRVVVVATAPNGNVDVDDLRKKAAEHRDRLSCLMITYPSTHGVFEDDIRDICDIVHEHGGQVYMDGANMNAQVGLTSPASIGADVCHLNLHKTFAIPHGGGGPGMGPIGVATHLAPYLPGHPLAQTGGEQSDPRRLGGAVGQRQHPADLVRATSGMLGADRGRPTPRATPSSTPTTSRRGSSSTTRCSTRARTAASRTS